MFTGIITDIGTISKLEQHGDLRVRINTQYDHSGIDLGASIACSGVCLTVVEKGAADAQSWFEVDISTETTSKTNIGAKWQVGAQVNLERALKVGDELGGHIVSGHVDGVATVTKIADEGGSTRVTFDAPMALAKYIAPKGSVALNGTSLTVNNVDVASFDVNFIPHTKSETTWGDLVVGDPINLEIDTLARYVARLNEMQGN
jgi:riboflavin synthase